MFFGQPASRTARLIYIATLIESFAVVTSGPELMAGSMPIFLKMNGRNRPSVVETIIAENIAAANAGTRRVTCMGWGWSALSWNIAKQINPPTIPQDTQAKRQEYPGFRYYLQQDSIIRYSQQIWMIQP